MFFSLILASGFSVMAATDADTVWKTILSQDGGPEGKPRSAEAAKQGALSHLTLQRATLENFVREHATDPRSTEAYIRLAKTLAAEGAIRSDSRLISKAVEILQRLQTSKNTSAKLRAEAAFTEAWITMQSAQNNGKFDPKAVLAAAEKFANTYKSDPRGAHMLTEAAGVCDSNPALKRKILARASATTSDPLLKRRIADDTRRLDLLGTKISFTMPALKGHVMPATGKPTLLVFWSPSSPQSLVWLRDLCAAWDSLPRKQYNVVTVAVAKNRSEVVVRSREFPVGWTVLFDGKEWASPAVRDLGINALPTVWYLDDAGVLKSINAKSDWKTLLR